MVWVWFFVFNPTRLLRDRLWMFRTKREAFLQPSNAVVYQCDLCICCSRYPSLKPFAPLFL